MAGTRANPAESLHFAMSDNMHYVKFPSGSLALTPRDPPDELARHRVPVKGPLYFLGLAWVR